MNRRAFLIAGAGAAIIPSGLPAVSPVGTTHWKLDNLRSVGGHAVTLVGAPRLIDSPWGPAAYFGGEGDAMLLDVHPLAGAERFRIDAWFRPDGGPFEQRWLHLEADGAPGLPAGTGTTRMLFEIRVAEARWYLDAFVAGEGYKQAMIDPARSFPLGRWYHVTQSFDGRTYRSFVNGQLQVARDIAFMPQGPGRTSLGMRMNRVSFFRGAISHLRFSSTGR